MAQQIMADRLRRGTSVVHQASVYARMAADDFLEVVETDEDRRNLLYHTLQAAADANSEDKIRTLAGVLASGAIAEDPAAVDEALLVINALAELNALDLRVLHLLTGIPFHEDWEDELRWTTGEVRASSGHETWPGKTIGEKLRVAPSMVRNIAARLESVGMVTITGDSFTPGSSDFYVELTQFAHRCLDHLLTVAGRSVDDPS